MQEKFPPWVAALIVSLIIQIAGAVWITGTFSGKFEEFRLSVNQRLERIERTLDQTRGLEK